MSYPVNGHVAAACPHALFDSDSAAYSEIQYAQGWFQCYHGPYQIASAASFRLPGCKLWEYRSAEPELESHISAIKLMHPHCMLNQHRIPTLLPGKIGFDVHSATHLRLYISSIRIAMLAVFKVTAIEKHTMYV